LPVAYDWLSFANVNFPLPSPISHFKEQDACLSRHSLGDGGCATQFKIISRIDGNTSANWNYFGAGADLPSLLVEITCKALLLHDFSRGHKD
jgi:hypothetical protein